jgi:hypothetical protein
LKLLYNFDYRPSRGWVGATEQDDVGGAIGVHAFVEWNGEPVKSVKKGFAAAVRAVGLPTAGQDREGVKTWIAAGFLGMTEKKC